MINPHRLSGWELLILLLCTALLCLTVDNSDQDQNAAPNTGQAVRP